MAHATDEAFRPAFLLRSFVSLPGPALYKPLLRMAGHTASPSNTWLSSEPERTSFLAEARSPASERSIPHGKGSCLIQATKCALMQGPVLLTMSTSSRGVGIGQRITGTRAVHHCFCDSLNARNHNHRPSRSHAEGLDKLRPEHSNTRCRMPTPAQLCSQTEDVDGLLSSQHWGGPILSIKAPTRTMAQQRGPSSSGDSRGLRCRID